MGNKPEKRRSNDGTILAVVLIGIGIIWLFQKGVFWFNLHHFYPGNLFFPLRPVLHDFRHFIFSWPVIFIIVGLILMAGRRTSGIVLIVAGGIFLIPKIIHLPLLTVAFIFPLLLIALGVILIAKFFAGKG